MSNTTKEFTPAEKKQWAEKMNAKKNDAWKLADETITSIFCDSSSSINVKRFLDLLLRLPKLSLTNALIVFATYPHAQCLKTFDEWEESNVHLKKGQKGLSLLKPGDEYKLKDGTIKRNWKLVSVFDISQTTGKYLPDEPYHISDYIMLDAMEKATGDVCVEPCDKDSDDMPENVDSMYYPEQQKIVIRKGQSAPDVEYNLVYCTAMSLLDNGGIFLPGNYVFEATCIAYLVCSKWNVLTNEFTFPRIPEHYCEYDGKQLKSKLSEIKKCAKIINTKIYNNLAKEVDLTRHSNIESQRKIDYEKI